MSKHDIAELNFEDSLAKLQSLVAELERGDGGLADQIARYEQGMTLISHCNELLDKAELRVQELLPGGEEAPFAGPMDSRS
ncbi:MAG: exodeoxyribonuclease VII small subunit [Caldilineales bacterium]|nr:exodeoxyribonuclease VII small subunit [Caldilineales bacterium]